jgi:phosphoribulokinase
MVHGKSLKDRLLSNPGSYIIGVAGDSGAGKSTFAKGIISMLGGRLVSSFSTDDYHKEDREQRARSGILPLDPKANRLDLLTQHIRELKAGKSVLKPVYNHRTGRFDPDVEFKPTPIVIVEGLHPYYTSELRRLIDFKIFVDPSRRVKYVWKIRRDIEKRGIKPERVKEEMMAREPLYRQYVDPQKLYADLVLEVQPTKFHINPMLQLDEWGESGRKELYRVNLIQQPLEYPVDLVSFSITLPELLKGELKPFSIEYYPDVSYGRKVTVTGLDGEIHQRILEPVEKHVLDHLGSELRSYPGKKEYMNAVEASQLLVCWRVVEKIEQLMKD